MAGRGEEAVNWVSAVDNFFLFLERRKGGGMSLQTISDAEEYKSPPLTEWEKLMQNRADHVPFDRKSLRKSKTTTNKFDADLIEKNHEPQTWKN